MLNPLALIDTKEPSRYEHSSLARVYVANRVAVPTGLNDIPLSVANANENGCFTFSPFPRYTANTAGRYFFCLSMGFDFSPVTTSPIFYFFVAERYSGSGTYIEGCRAGGLANTMAAGGQFCGGGGAGSLDMNVGDYLRFRAYLNSNGGGSPFYFGSPNVGEWDYVHVWKMP